MNDVIFMGRVVNDVTMSYAKKKEGKDCPIAKFSLAVDEGYGENKKTNFFNLTAFYKNAEFAEKYVKKGQKYLFICHATNNNYEDKNGVKRYEVVFIVDRIEFASSTSNSENNSNLASTTNTTNEVSAPSNVVPSETETNSDPESADLGFLSIY